MARQSINTGSTANDGTGDTLRQAGRKINANFAELYGLLGGDSATLGAQTQLTDSSVDFNGINYITRLNAIEGKANVTISLPDSDGIITLNTATQTLTNKTISADNNTISGIAASSFVLSNASGYIDGSASAKAIPSGVVVGTTDIQTLTNKTLTTPTLTNPKILNHILDSNGADLLHLDGVPSAVNHIDIMNAASGSNPQITVEGDDANISLELSGVGTGGVIVDKLTYGSSIVTSDGTVSTSDTYIICNKASTLNLSMNNGSLTGEVKFFTNKGAGSAVITPINFSQGTSVTLIQYGACHFIWDGNGWYLTGYSRDSDITIA